RCTLSRLQPTTAHQLAQLITRCLSELRRQSDRDTRRSGLRPSGKPTHLTLFVLPLTSCVLTTMMSATSSQLRGSPRGNSQTAISLAGFRDVVSLAHERLDIGRSW